MLRPAYPSNMDASNNVVADSDQLDILEHLDIPRKDMDLSSYPTGVALSQKGSLNNLRIQTPSGLDLHDRYMSSEEEPSPSPDSETSSHSNLDLSEPRPIDEADSLANEEDQVFSNDAVDNIKTATAIAVPIMAIGPPKLVNIASLAPMHKRKRSTEEKPTAPRAPASNIVTRHAYGTRQQNAANEALLMTAQVEQELVHTLETDDRSVGVPPPGFSAEEDLGPARGSLTSDVKEREEYAVASTNDDPFSLAASKAPFTTSEPGPLTPGSVARARRQAAKAHPQKGSVARARTKGLSFKKPQDTSPAVRPSNKKAKMLPRGATERTRTPVIPPFSS